MSAPKYRGRRFLATLLALTLVAAGCGDDDDISSTASEPAAEPEVVVDLAACNIDPPADAADITIIYWSFEATEFYADEIEKCDDVDNISISRETGDFTKIKGDVDLGLSTGGDAPFDIIHASNPELTEWGSAGWLFPLNDLIDKYRDQYDLDDIPQSAWDGATAIDGNIYGVPMIGDSQIIAYRSDLFEEIGLDVPVTYDEIIAACGTLADVAGIDVPFVIDFSAGWAMEIEFLAALRSFDGDYLDADNGPAFAGPEGVAALEKMIEVKDACMGDAYLAYGYEAGEAGLNNGSVAMVSIWATSMASFNDPDQSEYSDVIAYAPAAAPNPGSKLGGTAWHNFFTIAAETTNDPDLVFRVIMEAADVASQTEGAAVGVVTRTSVQDGVPTLVPVNQTIADGVGPYEPNPAIALVMVALGNQLPFVASGDMTAQEALDAAAEAYITEATAQGYIS